jgi:hypothetical protein
MAKDTQQRDDQLTPVEEAVAGPRVRLPIVGEVTLPPADKLAYYAGIGLLAALDLIEWPIALVIVTGHVLAAQHLHRVVRGIGQALEEA